LCQVEFVETSISNINSLRQAQADKTTSIFEMASSKLTHPFFTFSVHRVCAHNFMRNTFLSSLFSIAALAAQSQTQLVPGDKQINTKYLKQETNQMVWYAQRDTTLMEIGKITNEVSIKSKKLYIVQQIQMKGQPLWVDSTVVSQKTFAPIYHSSYNAQRDMVMNFGKTVTGYYADKTKKTKTTIAEKADGPYFDSNFYPNLLRTLPLSESYTATFTIFDYNPTAKIGMLQARILSVSEGRYLSKKLGERKVWLVKTSDDISAGVEVTHFIDAYTRQLWQQEINIGSRKMVIRSVE
jgi:hypothetical protein